MAKLLGSQAGILRKVRAASSKVLEDGRDVIVDAMHVLPEHRLRQISIAPPDIRIKYVVIDRPRADKLRDAGWRAGRGIVEKYDDLFPAQVARKSSRSRSVRIHEIWGKLRRY
jgi:hypothetical protein